MRKICSYVLIAAMVLPAMIVGCGAQYRNAALNAHEEADRITGESIADLYTIAVKQAVGLIKARLKLEKGNLDAVVTVTDKNGVTHQVTKLDQIINDGVQAVVDAGWLKENAAKARGLNDLAWVYMASRESFLEVFVKDVKAALGATKETSTSQPVQ